MLQESMFPIVFLMVSRGRWSRRRQGARGRGTEAITVQVRFRPSAPKGLPPNCQQHVVVSFFVCSKQVLRTCKGRPPSWNSARGTIGLTPLVTVRAVSASLVVSHANYTQFAIWHAQGVWWCQWLSCRRPYRKWRSDRTQHCSLGGQWATLVPQCRHSLKGDLLRMRECHQHPGVSICAS